MTKRASQLRYSGGRNEAGNSVQRCGPRAGSSENVGVKIRVAVFFDGTLNNRTNVWLGQQGIVRGENYKNKGQSYRNHYTNIAILSKNYEANYEYDFCFPIYVEGVGTTDEKGDTIIASALGVGITGVLDKVRVAITKVSSKISDELKKGCKIECIHIDSFGFSRGAAAARNFVYQILREEETLKLRIESCGYNVNDVKVKFLGLFDTVASYCIDHNNDTEQLHLDATKHAEHVVQLAAADEHRKNFPLTNIDSALQGLQLFLPGAHSDIGGGYADEVDEIDLQVTKLQRLFGLSEDDKAAICRERQWLLESGWYHEAEFQDISGSNDLKVTRRGISNLYSRIPLKMMAHYARQRGVYFTDELPSENEIPPPLKEMEQLLFTSPTSSPDYWLNIRNDLMKCLRHDYLHFSAYYGSTMGCHDPNFTEEDPVRGFRKRDINDG